MLLPSLLPGAFDVACELRDNDQPLVEVKNPRGWFTSQHPVIYEASGSATIEAGRLTRIVLQ